MSLPLRGGCSALPGSSRRARENQIRRLKFWWQRWKDAAHACRGPESRAAYSSLAALDKLLTKTGLAVPPPQLSSAPVAPATVRTTSSLAPATTADKPACENADTIARVFQRPRRRSRPAPSCHSVCQERRPLFPLRHPNPSMIFLARAHSVRRDVIAPRRPRLPFSVPLVARITALHYDTTRQEENLAGLYIAAEAGSAVKVDQLLMQGAPTNACGPEGLDGFTALHYASSRGHIAVAERLVRAGSADLEPANKDEEVPLHLAAYGGHLTIVELLLDSGAEVDVRNGYGETPLFLRGEERFLP